MFSRVLTICVTPTGTESKQRQRAGAVLLPGHLLDNGDGIQSVQKLLGFKVMSTPLIYTHVLS